MKTSAILVSLLILGAPAAAQQGPESAQVDDAVQKAAAFLLKKYEKGFDPRSGIPPSNS